jgi:hypothetical protein
LPNEPPLSLSGNPTDLMRHPRSEEVDDPLSELNLPM